MEAGMLGSSRPAPSLLQVGPGLETVGENLGQHPMGEGKSSPEGRGAAVPPSRCQQHRMGDLMLF